MHRRLFRIAALLMALAVAFGAFGAHLLKRLLMPALLEGYQTAVHYQMIHAIGIFIAAFLFKFYQHKKMWQAAQLFLVGILLFSGSIYTRVILSFADITSLGLFNLVTPLGGVFFIAGWIWLLFSIQEK
jgi:uncharacterized membrane protein YgdD (TMEM256/DUF423 family)